MDDGNERASKFPFLLIQQKRLDYMREENVAELRTVCDDCFPNWKLRAPGQVGNYVHKNGTGNEPSRLLPFAYATFSQHLIAPNRITKLIFFPLRL